MTFKELLTSVSFNDVWAELNKEYSMEDEEFEVYLRVFNELKNLTPYQNHNCFYLVVAKVEDQFASGTFFYDVFGVKNDNSDHYALELMTWRDWLSFEVVEKCIEVYGEAVVVAHSIYELTFFGYDDNDVEVETKKECKILKEQVEEIKNGTAKTISWDEMQKKMGYIDNRTEEEKELKRIQFAQISAENKKVYERLLQSDQNALFKI